MIEIREALRVWVVLWLEWVLQHLRLPEPPVPEDPILVAARKVVVIADAVHPRRPTRHLNAVKNLMATKLLRELFPATPTRKLKLAIELALNEESDGNDTDATGDDSPT